MAFKTTSKRIYRVRLYTSASASNEPRRNVQERCASKAAIELSEVKCERIRERCENVNVTHTLALA
jgi:hypothetical protein